MHARPALPFKPVKGSLPAPASGSSVRVGQAVAVQYSIPILLRFVGRVWREWDAGFPRGFDYWKRLARCGGLTKKSCRLVPQTFDDPANVLPAHSKVVADLPQCPALTPVQTDDPAPQTPLHGTKSVAAGENIQKKGTDLVRIRDPRKVSEPLL